MAMVVVREVARVVAGISVHNDVLRFKSAKFCEAHGTTYLEYYQNPLPIGHRVEAQILSLLCH